MRMSDWVILQVEAEVMVERRLRMKCNGIINVVPQGGVFLPCCLSSGVSLTVTETTKDYKWF